MIGNDNKLISILWMTEMKCKQIRFAKNSTLGFWGYFNIAVIQSTKERSSF